MKKPPAPAQDPAAPSTLPQTGGAYTRLPDGTLRLDEATDRVSGVRVEAPASAVESLTEQPVKEA
ncbi:hypothetical protein [Tabrizicola flagellatus]|uniref:hypothetical protein n=1 Tax=Tabrizicola flagellatus TaxID=2593021 RepID=UPI0011F35E38|nr:hypothetical protein [Tabrizicola flagellatus]